MTKEGTEKKHNTLGTVKALLSSIAGPHNTMERFCVVFLVFAIAIGGIFVSAAHTKYQNSKITLTEQALYGTDEKTFSLTQDIVKVKGLWTNEGKTKAFILLYLSGGMDNLSTNAEDYQMFMTGVNSKLTSSPTGSIYVFGSTGYIGLGFTDAAGFDPAAYKITLRNLSYMSEGDQEAAIASHDGQEGSYAYHNEISIIANFAASGAQTANFYSKADYTAKDIYNELVQSELIAEKQAKCDEVMASINTSMRKANEYARRLETAGIMFDYDLPEAIYGDTISTEGTTDDPVYFDSTYMMYSLTGKLNSSDGYFDCVDTNDSEVFSETDHLYLSTDYVFPGGLNYNYQELTADYDLLSEIIPTGMTYKEFVESLNDQQSLYEVDSNAQFGDYIDTANGTTFAKDESITDVVGDTAKNDISNFEEEISNIYSKKRELQITQLRELLKLYYDSASMDSIANVYMASDALVLY